MPERYGPAVAWEAGDSTTELHTHHLRSATEIPMVPLPLALSFTDSWRTNWVVYEEPQCRVDCRHTSCGNYTARSTPNAGSSHTLVFATDLVVRRVSPVPDFWWTSSPARLERLCNTAIPSDRTTAVDSMVTHLMSLRQRAPASPSLIVNTTWFEAVA